MMKNNLLQLIAQASGSCFLALLVMAIPFLLGMAVMADSLEAMEAILLTMAVVTEFMILFAIILADLIETENRK